MMGTFLHIQSSFLHVLMEKCINQITKIASYNETFVAQWVGLLLSFQPKTGRYLLVWQLECPKSVVAGVLGIIGDVVSHGQ